MSTSKQKAGHHSTEQSKGMTYGYPREGGRCVQSPKRPTQQPPNRRPVGDPTFPLGGIRGEARRPDNYQQSSNQNRQINQLHEQTHCQDERISRRKKLAVPQSEESKTSQNGNPLSTFFLQPFNWVGFNNVNTVDQNTEDPMRETEREGNMFDVLRQHIDWIETTQKQEQAAHRQQLDGLEAALNYFDIEQQSRNRCFEATSSQLQSAEAKVDELQKEMEENEAVITKAHEAIMSTLSKSVSRAVTDDMINDELKRFYQNDFFSWCADMSPLDIPEPEKAKEKLQSERIINSSKDYLNEPNNLQFPMDLPDGKSGMLLLQAALSQALCQTFLQDAYFLVEMVDLTGRDSADRRRQLKELEDLFYKVDKDVGVDWRIQTVESLEKAIPLGLHLVENKAKTFIQDFQFLLKEVDEDALKDLVQLFIEFGSIALKLWKTRTVIKAHGLSKFAEQKFNPDSMSPHIEAYGVASPAARRRLQGHYIGVVVRPLIISEPLEQDGEANKEVVWLKAVGWMPDFEGPVDTPMQDATL